MNIFLYVTAFDKKILWDRPKLVLKYKDAKLPSHPDGMEWLFFVTTTWDDELVANQPFDIPSAFGDADYFIFDLAPLTEERDHGGQVAVQPDDETSP